MCESRTKRVSQSRVAEFGIAAHSAALRSATQSAEFGAAALLPSLDGVASGCVASLVFIKRKVGNDLPPIKLADSLLYPKKGRFVAPIDRHFGTKPRLSEPSNY